MRTSSCFEATVRFYTITVTKHHILLCDKRDNFYSILGSQTVAQSHKSDGLICEKNSKYNKVHVTLAASIFVSKLFCTVYQPVLHFVGCFFNSNKIQIKTFLKTETIAQIIFQTQNLLCLIYFVSMLGYFHHKTLVSL